MKNKLDILITTFLRNDKLANLVSSIPEKYKERILIGDQNEIKNNQYWDNLIYLPYNCGLSVARNELVRATEKEFVLILEDDFEFTHETNIEKMIELMSISPEIGIVGGRVQQNDIDIPFEFIPTIEDGILYHKDDGNDWKIHNGIIYKETGCCLNFMLVRREVFKDVRWDEKLKLREHVDFFLRLKNTKWKVLFTPDVKIKDAKTRPSEEYKRIKKENQDLSLPYLFEKHIIHKIIYKNGFTYEIKNGIISHYKSPINN